MYPILSSALAEQHQADMIRRARRYNRVDSGPRSRGAGTLTRWVRTARAALTQPTAAGERLESSGGSAPCCV